MRTILPRVIRTGAPALPGALVTRPTVSPPNPPGEKLEGSVSCYLGAESTPPPHPSRPALSLPSSLTSPSHCSRSKRAAAPSALETSQGAPESNPSFQ